MKLKGLSLCSLLFVACTPYKEQRELSLRHIPDSLALDLNNQAVHFIGQVSLFNSDSLNGAFYNSALKLLDSAIQRDSLFPMAYENKSKVLRRLNRDPDALATFNQLATISPEVPEVIMGQAMMLEKMERMELASIKYNEAMDRFQLKVKSNPQDFAAKVNIAFLYAFIESKSRALEEIRALLHEYPDNEELKAMEFAINEFDREEFIANF